MRMALDVVAKDGLHIKVTEERLGQDVPSWNIMESYETKRISLEIILKSTSNNWDLASVMWGGRIIFLGARH